MNRSRTDAAIAFLLVGFLVIGCGLFPAKQAQPEMWTKPEVLFNLPATEKLESGAKIMGKIAVVSHDSSFPPEKFYIDGYFNDPTKSVVSSTTYFPEEMYATKPEDIDTLIKLDSKKGNLLNDYISSGGYELDGYHVKVFSRLIDISIIDRKTSSVVAKQQIEFKEFPEGQSSGSVDKGQTRHVKDEKGNEVLEYVVPESVATYNQIKTALAKYSDKVKPAGKVY